MEGYVNEYNFRYNRRPDMDANIRCIYERWLISKKFQ